MLPKVAMFEKIGYIPDRRYLYDIKYKDGLFVIACSGSRDDINYKQANISIELIITLL